MARTKVSAQAFVYPEDGPQVVVADVRGVGLCARLEWGGVAVHLMGGAFDSVLALRTLARLCDRAAAELAAPLMEGPDTSGAEQPASLGDGVVMYRREMRDAGRALVR